MARESEEQLVQFPTDPNSYQMLHAIANGAISSVYRARCGPINSKLVAIKVIDLSKCKDELDIVQREVEIMSLPAHPNILRPYCFFSANRLFHVVMPFMSGGSLESIISASFPNGLPESCIAVVLKETLNALSSLHLRDCVHGDIKASNILLDSDGSVKLADYGISESIFKPRVDHGSSSSSSSLRTNDVAGIPYWMAPEVINSHNEYTFKADIWSFGITALKLAYGLSDLLPLSHHNEKNEKDKNFTKSFQAMVNSCFHQDPSKIPTAEDLLKHSFFKNCRDSEFLVENVFKGLPSVEERFKTMKQSINSVKSGQVEEAGDGEGPKRKRMKGWNCNDDKIIRFGGDLAEPSSVGFTAQVAQQEETTQVGATETIDAASRDECLELLKDVIKEIKEQREKMKMKIQTAPDMYAVVEHAVLQAFLAWLKRRMPIKSVASSGSGVVKQVRFGGETIIPFGGDLAEPSSVGQVVKGKEIEVGNESIDASEGIAQVSEEHQTTQVGFMERIEPGEREFLAGGLEILLGMLNDQRKELMITINRVQTTEIGEVKVRVEYATLLDQSLKMLDVQRQKVITAIGVLRGNVVLQDANVEELMGEINVLLRAETYKEKKKGVMLDGLAEFLASKEVGRRSKSA